MRINPVSLVSFQKIIIILFFLFIHGNQSNKNLKAQTPSARIYHSMIYHNNSGKILLFGGQTRSGWDSDLRDIWALDLENQTWNEVGVFEASPIEGGSLSSAYDIESDRVIFLNTEGETWAYHFEANKWDKMNPSQTPNTRAGHMMEYDSESDRVILFGGFGGKSVNDPVYDETWAYDFNTDAWFLMMPEKSPPKRMYHAMAYNSKSDRTVIWGGRLLNRLNDNSIWSYDYNSNTWSQFESPTAPQPELTYSTMVYRPISDELIMFGGATIITPFNCEVTRQTWIYDLTTNTWMHIAPKKTPPSMGKHAMTYNIDLDIAVVFGGEIDRLYSNNIINDTWIYIPSENKWKKTSE